MKTYKLRLDNKNIVVCEYEGKMPMQDAGIIDPVDNPLESTLKYLKDLGDWKSTEVIYPVRNEDVSKFIELASKPFNKKPYYEFQDNIIGGVEIPSERVQMAYLDSKKIAIFYDTDKENIENIFRWLLGYTDFPIKKEGDGNFYWRKELRKKLLEVGIDIK